MLSRPVTFSVFFSVLTWAIIWGALVCTLVNPNGGDVDFWILIALAPFSLQMIPEHIIVMNKLGLFIYGAVQGVIYGILVGFINGILISRKLKKNNDLNDNTNK